MNKVDAVFEGGGVKGIGLVGALSVIEAAGYRFENLAGTSAGAIVAALVAAGYTAAEMKDIFFSLDYNSFKDEGWLDRLGLPGKLLSVALEYGIYEGDFFEQWLNELLQAKGVRCFGDIKTEYPEPRYKYKLQVIASDITDRKLLVLPGDLAVFGLDPDAFPVSRAVRMSMSIPVFFEPVRLPDKGGNVHFIVDGGILSNYPVWLLDDNTPDPPWPTFGFKLIEPDRRKLKEGSAQSIKGVITFLKAMAQTMMEAHDSYHISKCDGDFDRTIAISTTISVDRAEKEIKTTDFDISRRESENLFKNGVEAAQKFIADWDFEKWKKNYRHNLKPEYAELDVVMA